MTEPTPLPSSTLAAGRRFELHERLGSGAFGEVFLATVRSTAGFQRKVALKLLHPTRFGDDDATRRIRDEARVLGRLHHSNIVTVLDLVRLETQWAVVMEYVEGADLERTLQALERAGRAFPAAAALDLMAQLADALDAAYNAEGDNGRPMRVVHRDVKPANIRVTPNGDAKILDFGIARGRARREAETGSYVIGTQRYMAPERIAGRSDGPASDVYSLAATTVELLTGSPLGRSPVLADRHDPFIRAKLRHLERHIHGDPQVVRRVAGLLYECLSHEPLDRPRAADLSREAAALAETLPGERLRAFGRRFIPQVDPLLGVQPDRVSGVLTERTTSRAPSPHDEPATLRTEADDPSADDDVIERRGGWLLPMLGAAGGVVLVGGFAGLVMAIVAAVAVVWVVQVRTADDTPAAVVTPAAPESESAPAERPSPAVVTPEPSSAGSTSPGSTSPDAQPAGSADATPVVQPVRPRARVVAPIPEPEEPAPIVSRAQVVVEGAQSIRVVCGGTAATGTSSARIMGFPAGECSVHAVVGEDQAHLSGTASLSAPRTVRCRRTGGSLVCD